jgi:hypothetical protein
MSTWDLVHEKQQLKTFLARAAIRHVIEIYKRPITDIAEAHRPNADVEDWNL